MSWYENTGTPGNDSEANSDVLRAEFAAISESFDLFPDLAGNPDKFLVVNGTGSSVVLLSKAELLELLNLDSEKTPTFSGLSLEGTNPEINLYDTNGTADARKWRIGYGAAQILFQALNDAGNVIANFFQVTKIGNAISSIVYGNSTDNPDHVFRGNIGGNKDPSFPLDLVPTDGTVTTLSRMSTVGLGINAIQRLSCDSGFSCYQFFGDEEDSNVFQVRANHVNGRYSVTVNTVEMLLMDSGEGTSFNGGDSFQFDPDGIQQKTIAQSVVAGSSTGQANGTTLTKEMNFITTVSINNAPIVLADLPNGASCTLKHIDAANNIQIWPPVGQRIFNATYGAVDAADPIPLGPGESRTYTKRDSVGLMVTG